MDSVEVKKTENKEVTDNADSEVDTDSIKLSDIEDAIKSGKISKKDLERLMNSNEESKQEQ